MTEKITSKEVIDLYTSLEKMGIKIWIDGGWSVDALLGEQIREHSDLDIAIQHKDLPKFREYMELRGYKELERDEDKKWNFILGNEKGYEVDVHAFHFDNKGHIIEGIEYPDGSLTGTGVIEGVSVRCIDPKHMVQFLAPWLTKHPHKYLQAISALCEKFGIEYPKEYAEFKKE